MHESNANTAGIKMAQSAPESAMPLSSEMVEIAVQFSIGDNCEIKAGVSLRPDARDFRLSCADIDARQYRA